MIFHYCTISMHDVGNCSMGKTAATVREMSENFALPGWWEPCPLFCWIENSSLSTEPLLDNLGITCTVCKSVKLIPVMYMCFLELFVCDTLIYLFVILNA